MPRNAPPPTDLELLHALRREHLRAVVSLDRTIAVIEHGVRNELVPRGCVWHADGITCTPEPAILVCLEECGAMFTVCARHGGVERARRELARHQWEAHQIDDRTREARR